LQIFHHNTKHTHIAVTSKVVDGMNFSTSDFEVSGNWQLESVGCREISLARTRKLSNSWSLSSRSVAHQPLASVK
jgi:hypothetical protein